jgi:hypothetical protein
MILNVTPTHKIRKATFGINPLNGMAFQVGSYMKDGSVIDQIVEDPNHFFLFGSKRLLIFVQRKKDTDPFLWKAIDGVPVVIEYFAPDGKEVNIL